MVAETAPTQAEEQTTSATPAEIQPVTPSSEPPAAGEQETGGLQSQTTGTEPSGTGSEDGEFKLEDQPEWKDVLKSAPETAPAKVELPGVSVEEAAKLERDQRHAYYTQTMLPTAEQRIKKAIDDGMAADEVWQREVQVALNALHGNYEAFSQTRYDNAVKAALSEDEAKLFFDRRYANPVEANKALVAIGRQMAEAEYKAKIDKGELFTPAQVKEAGSKAVVAYERYLREHDRLKGVSSGEAVRGDTPRSGRSDEEMLADQSTPIDEVMRIRARQRAGS